MCLVWGRSALAGKGWDQKIVYRVHYGGKTDEGWLNASKNKSSLLKGSNGEIEKVANHAPVAGGNGVEGFLSRQRIILA